MKDYRRIAEDFARQMKAKYGDRIERIILFGSVARGDYREDSDVDLLVVTGSDRMSLQSDLAQEAVDVLLGDEVVVSPLVVSAEEAARLPRTALGRELAREGLAIA
jgi:hypothetical protein